jgi:hypothetical protein
MMQRKITAVLLATSVAVCLVLGTGAKPWVTKPARQHRSDYPAHLVPAYDRPDSAGVVTFYAIGDWGAGGDGQAAVADLLRADLRSIGPREVRPFVLGAGDNFYPDGLPRGWPDDHVVGLYLDRRFGDVYDDCIYDERAPTFHSVLGNHDHRGDIYLWETFAEGRFEGDYGNPRFVSYPLRDPDVNDTNSKSEYDGLLRAAKEGHDLTLPEIVPLPTAKVGVIAVDTEAMIRLTKASLEHRDAEEPDDATLELERHWVALANLLERQKDVPWLMVLGHHPVATHGPHGGHHPRPMGLHLEALWEGTRGLFGAHDIQDLSHEAYATFADRMGRALAARHRVVYVSGHEHSLQLIWYKDRLLQVVSGAGSKLSPVGKGKDTVMKIKELGMVRFDVVGEELWIEFIYGSSARDRQSTAFRVTM